MNTGVAAVDLEAELLVPTRKRTVAAGAAVRKTGGLVAASIDSHN